MTSSSKTCCVRPCVEICNESIDGISEFGVEVPFVA